MAAIREEYILADRFSAGFNRLLRFLGQTSAASDAAARNQRQLEQASGGTGAAMVRLAEAALDVAARMGAAGDQAGEMARATTQAADASDQAAKAQNQHNSTMRQGASAADHLGRRLLSLAGAYASLRTAQQFIGMADTFTQTTARLERMNDGLQTTAELQEMAYQAAQRASGNYQDMIDMVSRLGTLAPEAFSSSAEIVAFAEQVSKHFMLSGTSAQGAQAAMLQLTQAMSSGVLRGEELNSILEQAPTIAQTIAEYMGVSVGKMRELAANGDITAQVAKNALFEFAERTNKLADDIPLTFSRAWDKASSAGIKAMQPAMNRLTELLNSELGQRALNGLIAGFELLGRMAAGVIDAMANGAQWVADNWDTVSVVLQFVGGALLALAAVSVASAMASAGAWAMANWPLLLIIAVVGTAIMAMYAMGMTSEEVFAAIGAGAGGLFAFGYNLVASAWNLLASFGEFFANFLNDPVGSIVHLLADLADFALSVLQNIAGAIDFVFGSHLAAGVNGWRNNVQDWANTVAGEKKVQIERMALLDIGETAGQWSSAAGGLGRALDNFSVGDVLGSFSQSGSDYSGMANSGIQNQLQNISADTSAIKRSVSLSEEDMKLLVDMAERQYVNHINLTAQTPVITINGQNTGDTEADLQWLENSLRKILVEQAASHTSMSYR